jgi:hypothetical protein
MQQRESLAAAAIKNSISAAGILKWKRAPAQNKRRPHRFTGKPRMNRNGRLV